jgi:hypothetical protein
LGGFREFWGVRLPGWSGNGALSWLDPRSNLIFSMGEKGLRRANVLLSKPNTDRLVASSGST